MFWLKFHKSFFLGVQLANSQNWCWTGATCHYLSQWWPSPLVHIWVTRPSWNAFYVHVGFLRKMLLQNKLEIWKVWGWHVVPLNVLVSYWHLTGLFWEIIEIYICPMKYFWNILLNIFSCDQAGLWMVQSVRLSVTPFSLCSHHHIIMKLPLMKVMSRSEVKGHSSKSNLAVSGL